MPPDSTPTDTPRLPLSGIKVADFGQYVAGPFCAAILAAFGADVVRIERPGGGTDRDLVPLEPGRGGDGALYRQMNRNKRSLALDLGAPGAADVVRRLIGWSDVVVANLPPAALGRIGLDTDSVAAANPEAILVTCSAYEESGPRSNLVGFDGTGQALSGAMHMTGDDGVPRKAYVHYVDFCTAAMSAFGVAMALLERSRHGLGQQVSASLLRTALTMTNSTLMEEAVLHPDRTGTASRAQQAGPADLFRTRDGWLLVQVASNAMFARWAVLVERPDLIGAPGYAADVERGDNGPVLSGIMQDWCASRTTQACLSALREARLPASEVLSPARALEDPALTHGDWFETTNLGGGVSVPVATPPIMLSRTPQARLRPAPRLGEHTEDVLRDVGYSGPEIAALVGSGVVAGRED
ncbi:MAG: CoA transferase [Bauldia litoralis]